MKAATQPISTKKQTSVTKKVVALAPHGELTPIQERLVNLTSQLILRGGASEDVLPFLAALYRHEGRNLKIAGLTHMTEDKIRQHGSNYAEQAYKALIPLWPNAETETYQSETKKADNAAAGIKEIVRADFRRRLRHNFEEFLHHWITEMEGLWLLSEILESHNSGIDMGEAISDVI